MSKICRPSEIHWNSTLTRVEQSLTAIDEFEQFFYIEDQNYRCKNDESPSSSHVNWCIRKLFRRCSKRTHIKKTMPMLSHRRLIKVFAINGIDWVTSFGLMPALAKFRWTDLNAFNFGNFGSGSFFVVSIVALGYFDTIKYATYFQHIWVRTDWNFRVEMDLNWFLCHAIGLIYLRAILCTIWNNLFRKIWKWCQLLYSNVTT